MEDVNQNRILEFPQGIVQVVRKLYNLDNTTRMNEAIDLLADWIRKQNHFKVKDYPRDYLERCIICSKGSVEKAKFRIERCCTMKTLLPSFFEISNPLAQLKEDYIKRENLVLSPTMTKDYYRVFFYKVHEITPDHPGFKTTYQFLITFCEYIRAHDYCAGYIIVLEYSDCSMLDVIKKMNITELRQGLSLITESYGIKLKQMHIVCKSKVVETFIGMLGQVLKDKIIKRIIVHKSIETLKDHIESELLPNEYGGKLKSLHELHHDWVKELSREENVEYFENMKEAATDERLRLKKDVNEEFFNMTGTFRTLAVD